MFFLFILGIGTRSLWIRLSQRLIGFDKLDDASKTEEVSFFEALSDRQKMWLLREEMETRDKFGIKKFDDDVIEQLLRKPLDKGKRDQTKELIGVMTY